MGMGTLSCRYREDCQTHLRPLIRICCESNSLRGSARSFELPYHDCRSYLHMLESTSSCAMVSSEKNYKCCRIAVHCRCDVQIVCERACLAIVTGNPRSTTFIASRSRNKIHCLSRYVTPHTCQTAQTALSWDVREANIEIESATES